MSERQAPNRFEYKAEMKQLLDIIVHSLYTHPEVFLRELISNASDALNKVRFRKAAGETDIIDAGEDLKISITADQKKKELVVSDNGIGMTEEELINNLGTIAHSGTMEFVKALQNADRSLGSDLIGKFGVGFYACFMVADRVEVLTRYAKEGASAYKWTSDGKGSYTVEPAAKEGKGTEIRILLKKEHAEFAEESKIRNVINKYSNFADFPIFFGKDKVNNVMPLWYKRESDISDEEKAEFYKFISNDAEPPMGSLHVNIEGTVSFKALLFIPSGMPYDLLHTYHEKSLNLYCNKVLVQRDCTELLPEYLRFVRGVVDTNDLPLNVSREVAQSSAAMARIRGMLVREILGLFKKWAAGDKEKYESFYRQFGRMLSVGVNTDFERREEIIELLRFESSSLKKGELTSLKEYADRAGDTVKDIYYISGDSRDNLFANPNMEYFTKNGIEVLLLTDPTEIFILPSLGEYNGKRITSVEKSDIDLKPEDKVEKPEDSLSKSLIAAFKTFLGESVEDVVISKRLVNSPVTLVAGKAGLDPQMERVLKAMDRGFSESKKVMEVNIDHPVIRNLSRRYIADSNDPIIEESVKLLYEGALFMEGSLKTVPDFVSRVHKILEEATKG